MKPDVAFPIWSGERAQRVAAVLDGCLPPAGEPPQTLHQAMHYSVLSGGKRVRAMLAYAAGEFAGAEPNVVDAAGGVRAPGSRLARIAHKSVFACPDYQMSLNW